MDPVTGRPIGTAFIFPCVTGLLSRVVPGAERGLYMGVQHTFGGVSRVIFPIGAGILMDRFGAGVPFWIAALLVIATLPLTAAMESYLSPALSPAVPEGERISSADVTAELPTAPRT
jgi:MFS family permease